MEFTPASQNGIVPQTELLSLPSKFGILVSNTSTYFGKPFLLKAVSDAQMYKTEPVTFKTYSNGTTSTLGTASFIDTANAILVLDSLSTGTHQIWAEWPGEGLYAPTTTELSKVTVAVAAGADLPGNFTLTTNLPSGSVIAGSQTPITFTAEFSTLVYTVIGNVIFYNGQTQIGSAFVEDNKAVFTISDLPSGDNEIRAVWGGGIINGTQYQGRSASVTYNVLRGLTIPGTMSLAITPSYGVYNEGNIKLSATLNTSTELLGNVYFSIDGNPIYYAPFAGSTATIEFANNAYEVGSRTIEALWDGNQSGYPRYVEKVSTSTWTIYERDFASFTSFSVTPRSAYGYDTVFTAILDKDDLVGNVGFYTGNTLIGSGPIVGNSATYTTRSLAVGTYTVYAYYGGSSVAPKYFSTSSNTATMVITEGVEIPASMVLTVTNDPYFGTTDPYVVGENQTIKVTISTSTVLTGEVKFTDNDVIIGSANWNGHNTATFTTAFATTGSHSIQARWAGSVINDVLYARKASNISTVTSISAYTMGKDITLTALSPSIVDQPVVLAASISTSSTMTGVVTFFANNSVIGTSTWSSNIATTVTSFASTGSYAIQAYWEGGVIDGTRPYYGKYSSTATQVINQAITPTISSGFTPILAQEDVPINVNTAILGTDGFIINNGLNVYQDVLPKSGQAASSTLLRNVTVNGTQSSTTVVSSPIAQGFASTALSFSIYNTDTPVYYGSYIRFFHTELNSGTGFNSTSSSVSRIDVIPRATTSTIGIYLIDADTTATVTSNYISLVSIAKKTHRLYLAVNNTATSGVVTFTYKAYNDETVSTTATMINGVAFVDVYQNNFALGDCPVTASIGGTTYSKKLNFPRKLRGKNQTFEFHRSINFIYNESSFRVNFKGYYKFDYRDPATNETKTGTAVLDQTTGKYYFVFTIPTKRIFNLRNVYNDPVTDESAVTSVVYTNCYINLPSVDTTTYRGWAAQWSVGYDYYGVRTTDGSYPIGKYKIGDIVWDDNKYYRCIQNHDDSRKPSLNTGYWQFIADVPSYLP